MLISLDQIFEEYSKLNIAIDNLKNEFENVIISQGEYLTKKEQIEKNRINLYKSSLMTVSKFLKEKIGCEFTQYKKIEFEKARKLHSTLIKKTRQECMNEAEIIENIIKQKAQEQTISEEDSIKLFKSVTLMKEYYLAGLPVSNIKIEAKEEIKKHEVFFDVIKYAIAFYLLWFAVSVTLTSYNAGTITDISQYTFHSSINSNSNSFILLLSEIQAILTKTVLMEKIELILGFVLTAYIYEVILIVSLIYLIERLVNKTAATGNINFRKFFIGYIAFGIVTLVCEIVYSFSKGSIGELIVNFSNNIAGDSAIYIVAFVAIIAVLVIKIAFTSKLYAMYTSKYQI